VREKINRANQIEEKKVYNLFFFFLFISFINKLNVIINYIRRENIMNESVNIPVPSNIQAAYLTVNKQQLEKEKIESFQRH
jgi:hypothetical protein